jgi:hypothetical protein
MNGTVTNSKIVLEVWLLYVEASMLERMEFLKLQAGRGGRESPGQESELLPKILVGVGGPILLWVLNLA